MRLDFRQATRLLLPCLLLAAVPASSFASDGAAVDPSLAELAFERIRSLEGTWQEHSTEGWGGRSVVRVIAGGSAVLSTNEFDAHPGETMATVYHLDGGRLLLTHYCVAGNQPRLQATAISPDGRTIEFTFLDATSLASRDEGHMDHVIMVIDDSSHVTSRWSWYAKGEEQWLEEIAQQRVASVGEGADDRSKRE